MFFSSHVDVRLDLFLLAQSKNLRNPNDPIAGCSFEISRSGSFSLLFEKMFNFLGWPLGHKDILTRVSLYEATSLLCIVSCSCLKGSWSCGISFPHKTSSLSWQAGSQTVNSLSPQDQSIITQILIPRSEPRTA